MSRTGIVTLLVAFLAAAGGLGYSVWSNNTEPVAAPSPIEILLQQKYPDASGNLTDLSAYRGQVIVVNFWATWCAPCIEEMPDLSRLQTELTEHGVQFLGLGIDNAENVLEFSQTKVKVLYPLLVLGAAGIEMGKKFGNTEGGLPYTVVVDRNGKIADRTIGRVDIERLRRVILRTAALE
ncbi:MAG: TlpA disulfide reductase family protein [Burkholderiaceae bacterium]